MTPTDDLIERTEEALNREAERSPVIFLVENEVERLARAAIAAIQSQPEGGVEELWEALKQQCAADPEKAQRLVMVSRDDVQSAICQLTPAPDRPNIMGEVVECLTKLAGEADAAHPRYESSTGALQNAVNAAYDLLDRLKGERG